MTDALPVRNIQPHRRGSSETSAWVRGLRLRLLECGQNGEERPVNTGIPAKDVKHVLLTLAQYVGQDGTAFPSYQTLADDTEMSFNSIRRRLADAEYLKLIVRLRRWRDDNGINYEKRGRETSSEIRFLYDTTQDEVDLLLQARAADGGRAPTGDDDGAESDRADLGCPVRAPSDVGPSAQLGCPDRAPGVPTRRAPYEPLTEPLNPPQTPPAPPEPVEKPQGSRGEHGEAAGRADEDLDAWLAQFRSIYPKPSNHPRRVAATAQSLTGGQRASALAGARGARALWDQAAKSRKPSLRAPERFLADPALWGEWAMHAPPEPVRRVWVPEGSTWWRARSVLAAIRGRAMPRPSRRDGIAGAECGAAMVPLPDHVLALAAHADVPAEDWPLIAPKTAQWVRWAEWLAPLGGGLEERRHAVPGETVIFRRPGRPPEEVPRFQIGARVPCEWPPARSRASGTGPPVDDGDAQHARHDAAVDRAADERFEDGR